MDPPDSESKQLTQTALAALSRGDRAAAAEAARALAARRPEDANTHQVLGLVALEAGDVVAAKTHLERASAAAPNHPPILNSLGVALRRSGDVAGARKAFARSGELCLIDAWRNLGNLEYLENDPSASAAAYEHALALNADDVAAHAGLARALELTHELPRAKMHAERALVLDPRDEVARLALGQTLFRERDFVGAERAVAPVTTGKGSRTNRALAWGIIGDARDRRDEPRAAFQAFTAAKALLLEMHAKLKTAREQTAHPDSARRLARFLETSDVAAWRHPGNPQTPAPVFLVGFPRSGTTLLEQVLASHSRIVSIEERDVLAAATGDILMDPARLASCGELTAAEIEQRRGVYWRGAHELLREPLGERLLLDKLPLNIILLPLIARVFADAKVIVVLRDPRDVVLSCYQQRFGMNAAMAQFLDLESAAAYYDTVMHLFLLCRERLSLALHVVRYEDVIADLETTARALTDFLQLPFEPAMLRFEETARARVIDTPSAKQVLEPIYTRSVGRWRRYAEDLAPVLPLLDTWAARLGYAA